MSFIGAREHGAKAGSAGVASAQQQVRATWARSPWPNDGFAQFMASKCKNSCYRISCCTDLVAERPATASDAAARDMH